MNKRRERIPQPSPLGEGAFAAGETEMYDYAIATVPTESTHDMTRMHADIAFEPGMLDKLLGIIGIPRRRRKRLLAGKVVPCKAELDALRTLMNLPDNVKILDFHGVNGGN